MPIRVECSSCGKKLQVRDELLGKKVKCPGCQNGFVAAAATSAVTAAAPKSGQAKDKVSAKPPARKTPPPRDDDDDEDIEERPRRSEAGKRKNKAGKRKKKAASSSLLLIGIGAGVAVVLLALGAYFVFFSAPGPKKGGVAAENNKSKGAARNNDPGRKPRNDLTQAKDLEKYQISLPQDFTDLPVPAKQSEFVKTYIWQGPATQNIPSAIISVTVFTQEQAVEEAKQNIRQCLVNFSAGFTDHSGIKITNRGMTEQFTFNGIAFSRFHWTGTSQNQQPVTGFAYGAVIGPEAVVITTLHLDPKAAETADLMESIIATFKKK